jgi:hypothetical protein
MNISVLNETSCMCDFKIIDLECGEITPDNY